MNYSGDKISIKKIFFLFCWSIFNAILLGWIPWLEQRAYCATYSCSTDWTIPTFLRKANFLQLPRYINRKALQTNAVTLFNSTCASTEFCYVGVTRTPNNKYQKFMTYRLVHNIFKLTFKVCDLFNKINSCTCVKRFL